MAECREGGCSVCGCTVRGCRVTASDGMFVYTAMRQLKSNGRAEVGVTQVQESFGPIELKHAYSAVLPSPCCFLKP